ncbi:MAG: sterol desaturase family protein [Myxococcales bacterium]|nr:sterol desaturase family protein [Myxococcales bacterium]
MLRAPSMLALLLPLAASLGPLACDQAPARSTLSGWPPGEPVRAGACEFLLQSAALYHSTEWHLEVKVEARNTGPEAVRDAVYLGQGMIFGGLGQAIAGVVAISYAPGGDGLPLWLAAPLAIVLTDLCTYGFHRFVHANRFMWREHGIHHVPDKVNALDVNTAHWLDILLNNVAAQAPMLALGLGPEAIFIATIARGLQTFAIHANVDMRLGGLGHVLMGPEHHRLHHSARVAEAGNYATILTLWDRVFGTFTWAPGRRVERVGVAEPDSFPASHQILASALHPLRWWLGERAASSSPDARRRSVSPRAGR